MKAFAMTRHYEYTKEEKKKGKEATMESGGTIRTVTHSTAGCFFVSFVFLHGDCFQAVSRNIAHRKFICISDIILAQRRNGGFRHYFAVAEKSSADSDTILSGGFISHFRCGISGI
ncbi:MAG: hypothetical protein HDR09_22190 [Lachnospiraceae bacterium]|nr:hypothetical protein [Lachnospiraceae bacterium]